MTFGLTPQGFNRKRLADEVIDEQDALIAEFGSINTQPQSVFGQLIGVFSKTYADLWEELEDVYYSQYPSTAEGVALDYVVGLNGIIRIPAQRTSVVCVCEGFNGTLISQGALARQPSTNLTFFCSEDTTIDSSNLAKTNVSIDTLDAQIYNALINNVSNFYSLPKIEFDGLFVTGNTVAISINGTETSIPFNTDSQTTIDDIATALTALDAVDTATARIGLVINFDSDFVTSNSIVATVNGVALSAVPFNTDQATTLSNLATALQANVDITSATVTGAREITVVTVDEGTFLIDSIITTGGASQPITIDQRIDLTPAPTYNFTVNYANTTGGASQPNGSVFILEPSTLAQIVDHIVGVVNGGGEPVTAIDNLDNTFTLQAVDSAIPFTLSVSVNMSIEDYFSPVVFLSNDFSPISAPAGSITQIVTPLSGWISVQNYKDGDIGRNIESDSELRLRRQNSIRILGAGTVESIRARLQQEVANVTQVVVFENRIMTEEDLIVAFDTDFVTGNIITFTVNGVTELPINFTSTHLNTIQLIKVQLENIAGIDLVNIGGTGNRTLTIEMTQGFEISINNIQITGGASQPLYNISGGRFPKSFEALVEGGTDEAIAEKIWETKPAGIQTFGNTSFTITDSMGNDQVINFSRPTPIYIWIDIDLTLYDEEVFPANGIDLIEQAFVDYGNSLQIGEDVLFQRVLCQIFNVSGIASGSLQIASTLNEADSPSFGTSDISINESQLAIFSLTRTSAEVI